MQSMIKQIRVLLVMAGVLVMVGAGCVPYYYTKEDRQKLGTAFQNLVTDSEAYKKQLEKNTNKVIGIFKAQDKTVVEKKLEVFKDRETKKYIWGTVKVFDRGFKEYGQFLAIIEESGDWKIVYAGPREKAVPCKDMAQYNFPREILPECLPPLTPAEIETIKVQQIANDKERVVQLRAIRVALEQFKKDQGRYPKSYLIFTLGTPEYECLNKDGFRPRGCPNAYIDNIKLDPVSEKFRYTYESVNGSDYLMMAYLEFGYKDNELSLSAQTVEVRPRGFSSVGY